MVKITCHDILGNEYQFVESAYGERTGAYGVYICAGRVLLVKDVTTGNWDFPGGKIESGETLLEGLQREYVEETGLNIGSSDMEQFHSFTEYFYDLTSQKPWKSERYFYYISKVRGNMRLIGNGDDIAEARMISIAEIDHYLITSTTKTLIASAMKRRG